MLIQRILPARVARDQVSDKTFPKKSGWIFQSPTLMVLYPLCFIIPFILICCSSKPNNTPGFYAGNLRDSLLLPGDIQPDTLIDTNYLLGKFDPSTHPLFSKAGSHLTAMPAAYLRKETIRAFDLMCQAAKTNGINLTIVSATRNFQVQKDIWEAKWTGKRKVEGKDLSTMTDTLERARTILRYSSMPGTSRHHWGTDIDINSVEPAYFETPAGKKIYQWLTRNGGTYGFCQTYTRKNHERKTGYEEEAWHWSYTPLSAPILARYNKLITYELISGFKGAGTVKDLWVIRDYVNGIHPGCK